MARIGSSDLDVLPLVLGGNVFGWTADEATSFAVLDAFADAGLGMVDTADVYSAWATGNRGGESEEVLGRWAASRGRDRVVIATKVAKHPQLPGLHVVRRGRPAGIIEQLGPAGAGGHACRAGLGYPPERTQQGEARAQRGLPQKFSSLHKRLGYG